MKCVSVILATLACHQAVNALPFGWSWGKRSVSQVDLDNISLYEQYSAAAYCSNNNEPGTTSTVECSSGNCPLVQQAGANTVLEFRDQGAADATGFVAVDPEHKNIVLAYRGSRSVRNWIGNFDIEKESFLCDECEVHSGFLSSWVATRDAVVTAIEDARSQNPDFSLVVTGHSLGAAIATLAASELRSMGYDAAMYTFGSPMVGNDAYAQFVTDQPGGNFRVTHRVDAVPKLPGYHLFDFRHVSPQYWITSDAGQPVTADDVQISYGIEDTAGNYGAFGFSIVDHLWYLNSIAMCTPDIIEIF